MDTLAPVAFYPQTGIYFDPAVDDPTIGQPFPISDFIRNAEYEIWWVGLLANGSFIAPGSYQ